MKLNKKDVLRATAELSRRYRRDPSSWVKRYINFSGLKLPGLTWQQEDILKWFSKEKNLCISAGGGIGKSALMAITAQFYLITHPFSVVPTTAPTGRQLNDVLWKEMRLWLNRNRLRDLYEIRKGRLFIKNFPEWSSMARTVSKDQRELNDTLAGFHSEYLLIIVDEASGVPDPVFTALSGALTDERSRIALISNPVSSGGFYYDTITDPEGKGKNFKVLFYNANESPLVDKSYEEFIINRYGKDSPMYRAKVLGLPISFYDSVVVPPDIFDKVVSSQKMMDSGLYKLSVDPAGGGPDKAIFCHACGKSIFKWDELPKSDPTYISDMVLSIFENQYAGKRFVVIVDANGLGAGVYSDLVKRAPFPVIGFLGPKAAFHKEMFASSRVEGYYKLHKNFTSLHFPTPPPKRLKKELANLKFIYGEGAIQMEPKKAFSKRLGFSPDYADALMMLQMIDDYIGVIASRKVPRTAQSVLRRLVVQRKTQKYGKFGRFLH